VGASRCFEGPFALARQPGTISCMCDAARAFIRGWPVAGVVGQLRVVLWWPLWCRAVTAVSCATRAAWRIPAAGSLYRCWLVGIKPVVLSWYLLALAAVLVVYRCVRNHIS